MDYSHELNVIATGGIDGRVEIWNMDNRTKALGLVPNGVNGETDEITSIRFEGNGSLNLAVGTSKGKVLMYDMRYPLPLQTLTHHYRLPI